MCVCFFFFIVVRLSLSDLSQYRARVFFFIQDREKNSCDQMKIELNKNNTFFSILKKYEQISRFFGWLIAAHGIGMPDLKWLQFVLRCTKVSFHLQNFINSQYVLPKTKKMNWLDGFFGGFSLNYYVLELCCLANVFQHAWLKMSRTWKACV